MRTTPPVILTILDGWGYRAETHGNAIALARKPTYDRLLREYPNTLIQASNHFVGLPDGQMGNSEVGHLNLGAGRIVRMDITRIDHAIETGEFFSDPTLLKAVNVANSNKALHLIGLVSDGGVHSQQRHLYALLRLAAMHNVERVYVHAFLDGRDTMPTSGAGYIQELEQKFKDRMFDAPRKCATAKNPGIDIQPAAGNTTGHNGDLAERAEFIAIGNHPNLSGPEILQPVGLGVTHAV